MTRPGRTPFKSAVRDRRYAKIIEAAAASHPLGTMHVIPIRFPDKETAAKHEKIIYHEGRFQGFGRKVTKTVNKDGTVTLAFQLFDKEQARAYVANGRGGQGLAYNARRPRKES
jgi:hypothetical protein